MPEIFLDKDGLTIEDLVVDFNPGIDRARREGKAIGRPRASTVLLHAAWDMVCAGTSIRAAARAKGLREATLRRFLRSTAAKPGSEVRGP